MDAVLNIVATLLLEVARAVAEPGEKPSASIMIDYTAHSLDGGPFMVGHGYSGSHSCVHYAVCASVNGHLGCTAPEPCDPWRVMP